MGGQNPSIHYNKGKGGDLTDINIKLKAARLNAGLSQEAVAEQLGVSRQTMSNWENGRSSPDINNALKLSELYCLSLDELLKDSSKEKEEDVHFLKKHWYTFYHCAIATLPLASLVSYFGFPAPALLLRIIGLLLFCLPRLLFHRLFGGGLKNVLIGILGWCMTLFYYTFQPTVPRTILLSLLHLAGVLLIVRSVNREYESKNRTVSWIVVGIILASPLIMLFDTASSAGAFSEAAPFDHIYRVEEVLYQKGDSADTPIVELESGLRANYLYLTEDKDTLDRIQIGEFTYVEPAAGKQEESVKGIWQLVPENDADSLYRLTVEADDCVIFSYSISEQLQWKYKLDRVDIMSCTVSTAGQSTSMRLEWFQEGTFHGDLSQLTRPDIRQKGNIAFTIDDPSSAPLVLYEEYYHNGEAESTQYPFSTDSPLPEFHTRYESGEQYAIYRIPYENGAFIFCVDYSN